MWYERRVRDATRLSLAESSPDWSTMRSFLGEKHHLEWEYQKGKREGEGETERTSTTVYSVCWEVWNMKDWKKTSVTEAQKARGGMDKDDMGNRQEWDRTGPGSTW